MHINKKLSAITATSALALTAAGLFSAMDAQPAAAKDKVCGIAGSAIGSDLDWEFYLPGQWGALAGSDDPYAGQMGMTCQANGTWIYVTRTIKPRENAGGAEKGPRGGRGPR